MRTSTFLLLVGAALSLFGALWTTCSLVASLQFPVAGFGVWNLVAGLALMVTGGVMALRGVALRQPRPTK